MTNDQRPTYSHEPGATAVADKLGSAFLAGRLSTMTWGTALENALKSKGISKEFDERFAIAKDRPKWRQQTHSHLPSQPPWCLMA